MTRGSSNYVIIGAGLAGAATAWRLAAQGYDVTVLERATPANRWGSSHGSARILRYSYADPFYTDLVLQAKIGWDEVEGLTGRTVLTASGALDFGLDHDVAGLAAVLTSKSVPNELLSQSEAHERWPQFSFDSDVLWHERAGVIDAEKAVAAMLSLATSFGARIEVEWDVASVRREGAALRLTSSIGESLVAGHVIVCAGAWLPSVLSTLPLSNAFIRRMPSLSVMQEQAFHFAYRDDYLDPGVAGQYSWPAFIHDTHSEEFGTISTYGLPGGRDAEFRGQKVAQFNGGKTLRSAKYQDGVVGSVNRDRMIRYAETYLPGVHPEPYAETTCLFTNTPNEDFFIDSENQITVVSPCSGHGAKFAPAIGQITAEFVAGGRPVDDRFRLT